jgi:dihydrofolate reductase
MRTLIVCNIMSLDGYYEGPGNNVMALPMDSTFDAYNLERLRAADTLLLGRASYQGFMGFWPAVADDPAASEVHRETGRIDRDIDKVVVSDRLTAEDIAPWQDTTTVVRRADVAQRIGELKAGPGREILTFGSHTMWNHLLQLGLVDELHLVVGATVLGGGTPIFTGPAERLTLLDVRRFDGSQNALLRYAASAG